MVQGSDYRRGDPYQSNSYGGNNQTTHGEMEVLKRSDFLTDKASVSVNGHGHGQTSDGASVSGPSGILNFNSRVSPSALTHSSDPKMGSGVGNSLGLQVQGSVKGSSGLGIVQDTQSMQSLHAPQAAVLARPLPHSLSLLVGAQDGRRTDYSSAFNLADGSSNFEGNNAVRSPIRSPIRSPLRSPSRVPSITSSYEPENTMSNLFGPRSFSLAPEGSGIEMFGVGNSLFGASLRSQGTENETSVQDLRNIQMQIQRSSGDVAGRGGISIDATAAESKIGEGGEVMAGAGAGDVTSEVGNATLRMPPQMHPMSVYPGHMPLLHGGYYPPHIGPIPHPHQHPHPHPLPLPIMTHPHPHMQPLHPHMQQYPHPHPPFRGPTGPPGMMYPPFPPGGPPFIPHGSRHPMEIGPPPGMYPMMYSPPMYNMLREPPESTRVNSDGELMRQDMPTGIPLQDLRYQEEHRRSPVASDKADSVDKDPSGGQGQIQGPSGGQGQGLGQYLLQQTQRQQPQQSFHSISPPNIFGGAVEEGVGSALGRTKLHDNAGTDSYGLGQGQSQSQGAPLGAVSDTIISREQREPLMQPLYSHPTPGFPDAGRSLFNGEGRKVESPPHPVLTPTSSHHFNGRIDAVNVNGTLDSFHSTRPDGAANAADVRYSRTEPPQMIRDSPSLFIVDKDTVSMSPQRVEARAPRAAFISYLSGERQAAPALAHATIGLDRGSESSTKAEDIRDDVRLSEQLQLMHLKSQMEMRQSSVLAQGQSLGQTQGAGQGVGLGQGRGASLTKGQPPVSGISQSVEQSESRLLEQLKQQQVSQQFKAASIAEQNEKERQRQILAQQQQLEKEMQIKARRELEQTQLETLQRQQLQRQQDQSMKIKQQQQQQQQQQQSHAPQSLQSQSAPQKGQALLSLLRSNASSPHTQVSPFQGASRNQNQGPPSLSSIPTSGLVPLPIMTPISVPPSVPRPTPIMHTRDGDDGRAEKGDVKATHSPPPGMPALKVSKDGGSEVKTKGDAVSADIASTPALAPAKKGGWYRHTRGQEGVLLIGLSNGKVARPMSALTRSIVGPNRC